MTRSVNLEDLQSRLAATVPRAYADFVRSQPATSLSARGFDPKTLLVLNLELRGADRDGYTKKRFFLNGDGSGNYYFADLVPDARKALLWVHDPRGIDDPKEPLSTYLRQAVQECRIDGPVATGALHICRTAVHGESILEPITLEEWVDAVSSVEGVEYIGMESPGRARVAVGDTVHYIDLAHGRASLADLPPLRSIADELAAKLGARVLG